MLDIVAEGGALDAPAGAGAGAGSGAGAAAGLAFGVEVFLQNITIIFK